MFMKNRKHIRLRGFDYAQMRNYFITIIVKNHIHSFGTIVDGKMLLSENGNIAMEQWIWLGKQFPYIDLLAFVIMPDHVHGIIHINTNYYIDINDSELVSNVGKGRDPSLHNVEYFNNYDQSNQTNISNKIFKSQKIKSLPELIGAYKTTVSKRIHIAGDLDFKWQNSYYDHIIRNSRSLNRIRHYIETNPENWTRDL